ncbi:MAG: hypothetical protein AAF529_01375 [Pseudomonadota bacterium]
MSKWSVGGLARTVLNNADYVADKFSRLLPTSPAWLNGELVVTNLDAVPAK